MDSDRIQYQCPYCDKILSISIKYAGKWGKCKYCGGAIEVPKLDFTPIKREDSSSRKLVKNCPACGRQVPSDNAFCRFCGTKFDSNQISKNGTMSDMIMKNAQNTMGIAGGIAGGIQCLSAKNKRLLKQNLRTGETVEFCIVGNFKQSIVALNERLVIIKPGFMAGATFGARVTSFYYRDITGIEVNTGLINGVIEICTPSYEGTRQKDFWSMDRDRDPAKVSNCIPINKISLKICQPFLEKLHAKIDDAKRSTIVSSTTSEVSTEIERLAGLHSRGILSDEEFIQAKKKLLGL